MEELEILKRSSLLSLLLLAAGLFLAIQTYSLWERGPWDLPQLGESKDAPVAEEPKKQTAQPQIVSTDSIISKNLFDPERGAGQSRDAEASSLGLNRIRNFALLGTAILGTSRYAILQEPADLRGSGPRVQGKQQEQVRVKLGDTVEGFQLSEISDKKVVFTKGPARVELVLDFLRKVEDSREKVRAPMPIAPRVIPNVPRRGALPSPPVAP